MNVKVEVFLAFEDTSNVFTELMNDISDVLEKHGYSNNNEDPEAAARSLIVVKNNETSDVLELVRDSVLVIIPIEGEKVSE